MRTTITPKMAKEFLENNPINRKPSDVNISFLANEIKEGRFLYNGESIIIAEDGQLLDGQHRLLAVVMADKSIEANLVTGIPLYAMGTIDTGRARTASDLFSIEGIEHSSTLASVTKKIMTKANLGTRWVKLGGKARKARVSNVEMFGFYKEHKDDIDFVYHRLNSVITSGKYPKMLTFSLAGSLAYLLGIKDHRSVNYIREIFTGRQEGKSNVAMMIRDRLIKSMMSPHKLSEALVRNMIINQFDNYIEEKELSKLGGNVYGQPEFNVDFNESPNFLSTEDM